MSSISSQKQKPHRQARDLEQSSRPTSNDTKHTKNFVRTVLPITTGASQSHPHNKQAILTGAKSLAAIAPTTTTANGRKKATNGAQFAISVSQVARVKTQPATGKHSTKNYNGHEKSLSYIRDLLADSRDFYVEKLTTICDDLISQGLSEKICDTIVDAINDKKCNIKIYNVNQVMSKFIYKNCYSETKIIYDALSANNMANTYSQMYMFKVFTGTCDIYSAQRHLDYMYSIKIKIDGKFTNSLCKLMDDLTKYKQFYDAKNIFYQLNILTNFRDEQADKLYAAMMRTLNSSLEFDEKEELGKRLIERKLAKSSSCACILLDLCQKKASTTKINEILGYVEKEKIIITPPLCRAMLKAFGRMVEYKKMLDLYKSNSGEYKDDKPSVDESLITSLCAALKHDSESIESRKDKEAIYELIDICENSLDSKQLAKAPHIIIRFYLRVFYYLNDQQYGNKAEKKFLQIARNENQDDLDDICCLMIGYFSKLENTARCELIFEYYHKIAKESSIELTCSMVLAYINNKMPQEALNIFSTYFTDIEITQIALANQILDIGFIFEKYDEILEKLNEKPGLSMLIARFVKIHDTTKDIHIDFHRLSTGTTYYHLSNSFKYYLAKMTSEKKPLTLVHGRRGDKIKQGIMKFLTSDEIKKTLKKQNITYNEDHSRIVLTFKK